MKLIYRAIFFLLAAINPLSAQEQSWALLEDTSPEGRRNAHFKAIEDQYGFLAVTGTELNTSGNSRVQVSLKDPAGLTYWQTAYNRSGSGDDRVAGVVRGSYFLGYVKDVPLYAEIVYVAARISNDFCVLAYDFYTGNLSDIFPAAGPYPLGVRCYDHQGAEDTPLDIKISADSYTLYVTGQFTTSTGTKLLGTVSWFFNGEINSQWAATAADRIGVRTYSRIMAADDAGHSIGFSTDNTIVYIGGISRHVALPTPRYGTVLLAYNVIDGTPSLSFPPIGGDPTGVRRNDTKWVIPIHPLQLLVASNGHMFMSYSAIEPGIFKESKSTIKGIIIGFDCVVEIGKLENYVLSRYSDNGQFIFQRFLDRGHKDIATRIVLGPEEILMEIDPFSGKEVMVPVIPIYQTGYSETCISAPVSPIYKYQIATRKLLARPLVAGMPHPLDGTVAWTKIYISTGDNNDVPYDIAIGAGGNLFIAGGVQGMRGPGDRLDTFTNFRDATLLKYAPTATPTSSLWTYIFQSHDGMMMTPHMNDVFRWLTVSPITGSVYAAGETKPAARESDGLLVSVTQ